MSKKNVLELIADKSEKEAIVRYKGLNIVGVAEFYSLKILNILIPAVNSQHQKRKESRYYNCHCDSSLFVITFRFCCCFISLCVTYV